MPKYIVKEKCFMCGGDIQRGPDLYQGHYIEGYQICVCDICYEANWDGWNQQYDKKLLAHLKKENIPVPTRNEKGWIPREPT